MKSILLLFLMAFLFMGCYTTAGVTSEPISASYTVHYGYYGYYGAYPYGFIYPYYPRHYYPRIYVPSYYEKHPEYKVRDFGRTRLSNSPTPQQAPQQSPPKQNQRQQGNRR